MKTCPKCGFANQDDYKFCERCRHKFKKKKETKKDSPLSIVAAALSLFSCTYLLGALIAIVDLAKNDKTKRHLGSGFAIFMAAIYLFISISDMRNDSSNTSSNQPSDTSEKVVAEQEETEQEITIPNQTIYDDKDCVITVEGLEKGLALGGKITTIPITIQNNSSKDYTVSVKALAVNGLTVEAYLYTSVASGKTANDTINISTKSMENVNISQTTSIKTLIWFYDDAKNFKDFATGDLKIKTNVKAKSQKKEFKGKELYSKNNFTIELVDFSNSIATLAITNNNNESYLYEIDHISANGNMVDQTTASYNSGALYKSYITGKTKEIVKLEVDNDDKEKNSIDTVTNYSFQVNFQPEDDYTQNVRTNELTVE